MSTETKNQEMLLKTVNNLVEVEKEKVSIDKMREHNFKKELELSAQTSREAAELARIDLNNRDEADKRRVHAFSESNKRDFILKLSLLFLICILLVVFVVLDQDELAKILLSGLVGFAGGYGVGKYRSADRE